MDPPFLLCDLGEDCTPCLRSIPYGGMLLLSVGRVQCDCDPYKAFRCSTGADPAEMGDSDVQQELPL